MVMSSRKSGYLTKDTTYNIALAKWRVKCKTELLCFISAECVPHSAFFNNLASVETHRLRYC